MFGLHDLLDGRLPVADLVEDDQKENGENKGSGSNQSGIESVLRKDGKDPEILRGAFSDDGSKDICAAVGNCPEKEGQKTRSQKGEHEVDHAQKCKRNQSVDAQVRGRQRIGNAVYECAHRIENRKQKRSFLKVQKRENADTDCRDHKQRTQRCHEDVRFAIPSHTAMIAF